MKGRVIGTGEVATGVQPPRSFVLDASVSEDMEAHRIAREVIKSERVEYVFPDGLNDVDLFEVCRAIDKINDFPTGYKLMMKYLVGKPVVINLKHDDGTVEELCQFQVVSETQNLSGVDILAEYPILVNWLVSFIGDRLLKKYPTPLQTAPPKKVSEDETEEPEK